MLIQPREADTDFVEERSELRTHVANSLETRATTICKDAVAVFPFAGMEGVTAEDSSRLAGQILQLLAAAVRGERLDSRSAGVTDARELALATGVTVRPMFGLVYVMERFALDELALDESFGATSEPWPAIAQIVRRASFEVLAAFSERVASEPDTDILVDPLTTLHTRPVFLAALEKEIERSERFAHPFALILLDVDHLSDINARHGYGAGDRVLERIGILVRQYFRDQDWVARSSGDTFAVLLPETVREHAEQLADRVRKTVAARLELHDYRSDEQVAVTVSVGLMVVNSVDQTIRADQLMLHAKEAVNLAKQAGRNCVERVDITGSPSAPPRDKERMD